MRYVTVNKLFYVFIVSVSSDKCPINLNGAATRTETRVGTQRYSECVCVCVYFGSRLDCEERRIGAGRATTCGSCVMEKLASLALAISK